MSNLGDYQGCRDPAHLARWLAALNAGRARMPRCTGTTRLGQPCQNQVMVGATRCRLHLQGKDRLEHDLRAIARYERLARLSDIGEAGRAKARRYLETIRNRQLRHLWWNGNPQLPGALKIFSVADEKRIHAFLLRELGLDLDAPLPETGRPPTPFCLDACRRAGILHLQGRITLKAVRTRIAQARKVDQRYFARLDAMTATPFITMPTADELLFDELFSGPAP